MKIKGIIVLIILILIIIIFAMFIFSKTNRNKKVYTGGFSSSLANPIGPKEYDGNIYFYIQNSTEKSLEKIKVTSYDEGGQILTTTEMDTDKIIQDEDNIIKVGIPDDDGVKWNITVTANSKEYTFTDLLNDDVIYNVALVPICIEDDHLILVEEEE